MVTLYILQLENGKYYVGKTDDVAKRYSEHKSGRGSEWTRLYKPIKMLETRKVISEEDENATTKELMKKYGIDNVRGGSFVQKELPDFVKKTLELEQRGNTDACFKCGSADHWAKDCQTKQESSDEESEEVEVWCCSYCGREFDTLFGATVHERSCKTKKKEQTKPSQKTGSCYRCGRYGHWANQCYAKSTIDGDDLDSDDEYDSD